MGSLACVFCQKKFDRAPPNRLWLRFPDISSPGPAEFSKANHGIVARSSNPLSMDQSPDPWPPACASEPWCELESGRAGEYRPRGASTTDFPASARAMTDSAWLRLRTDAKRFLD